MSSATINKEKPIGTTMRELHSHPGTFQDRLVSFPCYVVGKGPGGSGELYFEVGKGGREDYPVDESRRVFAKLPAVQPHTRDAETQALRFAQTAVGQRVRVIGRVDFWGRKSDRFFTTVRLDRWFEEPEAAQT